MNLNRSSGHLGRGGSAARAREDGRGLDADIGRFVGVPVGEPVGDPVERLGRTQVEPVGRNDGNRDRLCGVVGPLAGGEIAEPAADHGRYDVGQVVAKLVARAEGVSCGSAEKDAAGAVELCG